MKHLLIVSVLMAAMFPCVMFSQNVWRFNEDSCVTRALASNAQVRNAELQVQAAQQTQKAALTKYFPSVQAGVSAFKLQNYLIDIQKSDIQNGEINFEVSHNGEDLRVYFESLLNELAPIFSQFGIDLIAEFEKFIEGFSYDASFKLVDQGVLGTVTAMQPVFAGGRIVNGNRLAKLGVEAAQIQKSLAVKNVDYAARQRYWLLVSLHEKRKTLEALGSLVDTLYRDVDAAYNASLVTRNDLLRVRIKQNELLSAKSKLSSGIALANMSLCQYLGLSLEDRIVPCDSADTMWKLPRIPVIADSMDVTQRDEFRLLELNATAEKLKKRMILGESLPQIGIGAGYSYSNLWGRNINNAGVFVSLQIPITSWWEGAHNYRRQKIMEQIALNTKDEYEQLMSLQARQLWDDICDLARQVEIYRETIAQSEENLRLNKDYYDAGMSPLSDFLEAQAIFQQSRDQYVDKCIEYKLKVLEYEQMFR